MKPWIRMAAAVLVLGQLLAPEALARAPAQPGAQGPAARAAATRPSPTPPSPALRPQASRTQASRTQAPRTQAQQARPIRQAPAATARPQRGAAPAAARPQARRVVALPGPAVARAAAPPEARRTRVVEEVRAAARATGFDQDMLLAIVMAESSLREHVRNPRSSAAGPLQFSTGTWLAALPAFAGRIPELAPHAARLEALADRERRLDRMQAPPRGRHAMLVLLRREQASVQRAALALRHDVRIAARVAALLAQEDAERFRALTGERPAGAGDIYAVHLLGVGAAADLARAARQRPEASVAAVLPRPVLAANPEIFLAPGGGVVSVRQARQRIAARIGPAEATPVQVAEAP